jgi:hypothetical protein
MGVPVAIGVLAVVAIAISGCGGGGGNGGGTHVDRGGIPFFPLVVTKVLTYTGGPNNPGQATVLVVTEKTAKNSQPDVFVMSETVDGQPTKEYFWRVINPATVYLVGERSITGSGTDVYYNPDPSGPGVFTVMTPPQGAYPSQFQHINATDGNSYTVETTTVGGLSLSVPADDFDNVMKVRQEWKYEGTDTVKEIRLLWLVASTTWEVGIIQMGHEDLVTHAEIIDSQLESVTFP